MFAGKKEVRRRRKRREKRERVEWRKHSFTNILHYSFISENA
jgi:hypothetical protein